MAYTKPPFYQSSTFWTHVAVVSAAVGSGASAVFDKAFLNGHPILAAVIVAAAAIAASISQFGYSLASGMKAQAQGASDQNVG